MPEAAIDEHRHFRAGKHKIDGDPLDSAMQAVTEAQLMECCAQTQLGKRILALDAAHDLRSRQRPSIRWT